MARSTTSKNLERKVKKCLAALLSEHQQNAGLSQQDLAAKANVGRKHMYLLASGQVLPRLNTLMQLLHAVGDNTAELVSRMLSLVFPTTRHKELSVVRSAEQILLGEDTCPKCQAVYTLHARRVPIREERKFKCGFCRRKMASWTGTTAFSYRVLSPPKSWH